VHTVRYSFRCSDLCFTINTASRNLWDHENREVYESSHSVVLALLAAHAQRVGDGSGTVPTTEMDPANFKGKEKGQITAAARPLAEKSSHSTPIAYSRYILLCDAASRG
jgi:hypothetical protein